jgi:hypothetical protein
MLNNHTQVIGEYVYTAVIYTDPLEFSLSKDFQPSAGDTGELGDRLFLLSLLLGKYLYIYVCMYVNINPRRISNVSSMFIHIYIYIYMHVLLFSLSKRFRPVSPAGNTVS